FDTGGEPAGLDVIDVVEVEAADRESLQIVDGGSFLNFLAPRIIFGSEYPRNKSGEAAGIFLHAANALEVIYAMAEFFAAAEHHGRGGAQAELVRGAVHALPIVASAFEARDLRANFVVENFRAAAGNGLQARVHQAANRVFDSEGTDFGDA